MTTNNKIVVYGTPWCGDCRRARRVFDQNQTAYEYIDIEKDETARAYVEQVNHGSQSVPTIIFPDGSILVEPSSALLTDKLKQLGFVAA